MWLVQGQQVMQRLALGRLLRLEGEERVVAKHDSVVGCVIAQCGSCSIGALLVQIAKQVEEAAWARTQRCINRHKLVRRRLPIGASSCGG